MTITSPLPGGAAGFLPRPSWIGNDAVTAAHTPGNANFDPAFRRIDGPLVASLLASEEAFWERMYWCNLIVGDDYSRIPPALVVFTGPTSNGAFPTSYTFTGPVYYGTYDCSFPSDREFSTRRIYRPALEWMLDNVFLNGSSLALWNSRPYSLIANSRDMTVVRGYSYSNGLPSASSLLSGSALAFPNTEWVDTFNMLSALSNWVGQYSITGLSGTLQASEDPVASRDIAYCLYGEGGGGPFTIEEMEAFITAHKLPTPSPNFLGRLDAAFGSVIDYRATLADKSRRITFDRLAAYNRIMAGLDRSYCRFLRVYQSVGLNTNATVSETLWGSIAASDLSVTADGDIVVPAGTTITWDTPQTQTTSTDSANHELDNKMLAEFSANLNASTENDLTLLATVRVPPADFSSNLIDLDDVAAGYANFTITAPYLSGTSIRFDIVDKHGFNYPHLVAGVADLVAAAGDVRFYIRGAATTRFSRSQSPTSVGPNTGYNNVWNYPIPAMFTTGRVREFEVGIGSAIMIGSTLEDFNYGWNVGRYTYGEAKFVASICNDLNAADAFYLAHLREVHGKVMEAIEDAIGFDPTDASVLESDVDDLVQRAKSNLTFSPHIQIITPEEALTARAILVPGTSHIDHIEFSDGEGVAGSAYLSLGASASAAGATIRSAAGHSAIFDRARIDWSFHTLRLNN